MINENKSNNTESGVSSADAAPAHTDTSNEEGLYSWQGNERTWLFSGASWYVYGAGIAIVLLFYALITQAWTMAVLVSLLAGVIYIYSQEQSPVLDVVLSSKGIYIGNDFHPYVLIKSCWFSFEKSGNYLVFALVNSPQARISISFKPEDKSILQTMLGEYLVIDEFHQDTWLERIEKLL